MRCAHCLGPTYRVHRARFCSDACRQAAYRRREADIPEDANTRTLRAVNRRVVLQARRDRFDSPAAIAVTVRPRSC